MLRRAPHLPIPITPVNTANGTPMLAKCASVRTPDDLELAVAARRFNEMGALRSSAALPVPSASQRSEDVRPARLFELHERSCIALAWHLQHARRRHSNALKIVASFVRGACNPERDELAALGALWSLPSSGRRHIQEAFDELANTLSAVLEKGQLDGVVRTCDCTITARLILGLVLWTPAAAHQAPPRKLLNRRRLVEGLQDLITMGRSGPSCSADRAVPPAVASAVSLAVGEDTRRFEAAVSRIINRAGAEAAAEASIAAELACTADVARAGLVKLGPALLTCQKRTIALALRLRDAAFAPGNCRHLGFVAFTRGIAEAYLREDVQPLSPLAMSLPESPDMGHVLRERWRLTCDLLRPQQVDGVARDEIRARFYDLSPIFMSAICAFLCSGLWEPGAHDTERSASEVADLVWFGLRVRAA